MPHETALIATIAAGLSLAFLLGLVAVRLRMPPLVGYLVAGVVVGPFTPGFVADAGLAQQLSEIGVILLMFGVGIHFSVGDLLAVRRIALPGAIGQITVATLLGAAVAHFWGWTWGAGLVFGLCLSVASTVVLLRAVEDRGILHTTDGRIAVGWLVVEDLVTVVVLVLLPAIAGALGGKSPAASTEHGLALTMAITLGKVVGFVALMLVVGVRAVPWLLARVARIGSRELFTLAVLAVALGIAVGAAALFDVSFALGAFFAGMVVNASELSHEAAEDALPLQDAFSVLFFVAVGMLFDPRILVRQPLEVISVVLIVMVGKSIAAYGIVRLFGHPTHTALIISASLAQIGEFSFILAALARSLGLLPAEGQSLIVAGALISITLNPVAFAMAARAQRRYGERLDEGAEQARIDAEAAAWAANVPLEGHTVLVGAGRVGRPVAAALAANGAPFVIVEQSRELAESLRKEGLPVVHGDATRADVMERAHLAGARLLVIAIPDPYQTRAMLDLADRIAPSADTVVRTQGEVERAQLEARGVGKAVVGERELALGMVRYALERSGVAHDMAVEAARTIRVANASAASVVSAPASADGGHG
jgi:CPA2 family monovalent cation:H+ antiporter-2